MDQNGITPPEPRGLTVRIPDHELLRCIGRGSYGEIWLARNVMGVYRAVKIVYRSSFKDHRPFERELSGIRKYEPISRSHEKFIDILQIGINKKKDYFYYVMELGDDCATGQAIIPENYSPRTLARSISNGGRLSPKECLELGLALSQALAELHKHGLAHRDIKPSNIIFVNGVAKLADIGLVADFSEAQSYVGTEGYIPPEGPGGPQSDVFSLGKVLYEASTGKDRLDFPELPTLFEDSSDQERLLELNEVVLHACQNDPRKRYPTAWEMYSDLLVIADGKSVKRLKFLERRLTQLKRAAAVAGLVAIVAAGITYHFYRERINAAEAQQQKVGRNIVSGTRAMDAYDLLASLPHFVNALDLDKGAKGREVDHRFRIANVLAQCPKLVQLWPDMENLIRACFSPDDLGILVVQSQKTQLFDLVTRRSISVKFGQGSDTYYATYNSDGTRLLTCSYTNVSIWRTSDGTNLLNLPHPQFVSHATFSPDGLRIVTACYDNVARIWNARTGELISDSIRHRKPLLFAAFSRDGAHIVTTSEDNTVQIWDANSGDAIGPAFRLMISAAWAAFSPDGKTLVIACHDHNAYVWDLANTRRLMRRLKHGDGVSSVEFSPDGHFILTACLDHTVRLWSADNFEPVYPNAVLGNSDRVLSASFSNDGRRIITAAADGTVRVWDLAASNMLPNPVVGSYSADGRRFLTITNNEPRVFDSISGSRIASLNHIDPRSTTLQLNRNGRFVLTISSNFLPPGATQQLRVWDAETARATSSGFSISNSFKGAVLSDDGKEVSLLNGKEAQVWDIQAGNPLSPSLAHGYAIISAFFNHRGDKMVTCGGPLTRVWDIHSGRELFAPLELPVPVRHVEFSPDESHLATCGQDTDFTKCYAQVWDARTGKAIASPLSHADGILWVSFSPDGKRVVTASEDFSAIVWDVATSRRVCPPLLHQHQVDMATFSPDGRWIVTASADRTVRVWNVETGDPLTPPLQHFKPVTNAFFLPDGHHVLTTVWGGKSWLWDLPTDSRPLTDLVSLSELLSGNRIGRPGELSSQLLEPFPQAWERLRNKYPQQFQTTEREISSWQQFQEMDFQMRQQSLPRTTQLPPASRRTPSR